MSVVMEAAVRMINWSKIGTVRHLARGEDKKFENSFWLESLKGGDH
jgi:hypothetical protein